MATGDRNSKGKATDNVVHLQLGGVILCGRPFAWITTDGSADQGEPTCKRCKKNLDKLRKATA
jgi:hypothetical protein